MKVTTLACDLCIAVVAAVGTRKLQKGRKPRRDDPVLDLCRAHLRTIDQAFVPGKRFASGKRMGRQPKVTAPVEAVERKRHRERERSRVRRERKGHHNGGLPKGYEFAPWAERETTVLSLLPTVGKVSTQDLWRQVRGLAPAHRLKKSQVRETIARLKGKGLVTQVGVKAHTKYARANGKASDG